MRMAVTRFAVALACLLAGCAGSGDGGGNGDGGGGGGGGNRCRTDPPPATVSFSNSIQPIFNRSCAVAAACHAGSTAVYGDLSVGAAYDTLVRKPSIEQPKVLLVRPGDPDASYLVRKVEGGPDITGEQMPLGCPGAPQSGALCLNGDDVDAIRTWIDECAQQG